MKKHKKRILSFITIITMIFGMISSVPVMADAETTQNIIEPASWNDSVNNSTGDWALNDGDVLDLSHLSQTNAGGKTIKAAGGHVTILGVASTTFTDFKIIISGGASLTIDNLNLSEDSSFNVAPISAADSNTNNTLIVNGMNTIKSYIKNFDSSNHNNYAGISVPALDVLSITGSGTINVTGGCDAAGIGGDDSKDSGTINISNATVIAAGGTYADASTYSGSSAGIGGGASGNCSTIDINDANVTAISGSGGAGIGGGYSGSNKGTITIEGCSIVKADATGYSLYEGGAGIGAGIGGIASTDGGQIIIKDTAHVTAQGGGKSAGIGGGAVLGRKSTSGTITIEGQANVTAAGSNGGAGIGAGVNGNCSTITIKENATVNAKGSDLTNGDFKSGGTGIGGGAHSDSDSTGGFGGSINIEDNANVYAEGGYAEAGIGSSSYYTGSSLSSLQLDPSINLTAIGKRSSYDAAGLSSIANTISGSFISGILQSAPAEDTNITLTDIKDPSKSKSISLPMGSYSFFTKTDNGSYTIDEGGKCLVWGSPASGIWSCTGAMIDTMNHDRFILQPGYKVTLDAQGGTEATQYEFAAAGGSDKIAKPADPTKNGDYVFKGWYTDSGCTTAYDFDAPVTSDLTLYAKWECTTEINVTGTKSSIEYGDTADFTAKVASTDTKPVTGTVQFYKDSIADLNKLGSPVTLNNGNAGITLDESVLKYSPNPYTILAVYSGDSNYSGSSDTTGAGITVNKKPATVKADDDSIYVGGTLPKTFKYTVTGLLDGDKLVTEPTFTLDKNADPNKSGYYTIYITGADAGDNYSIDMKNGTLYVAVPYVPLGHDGSEQPTTATIQGSIAGSNGDPVKSVNATVINEFNGTKTVEVNAGNIVAFKMPDGSITDLSTLTSQSSVISRISFTQSNAGSAASTVSVSSYGTVKAGNLLTNSDSRFDIMFDLGNGQKVKLGTLDIKVSQNGQVSLSSTLIDLFNTITDTATGKPAEGANVTVYYADTAKNKALGLIPGTKAVISKVNGIPGFNASNPMISDSYGSYLCLLATGADYYITAEKDGCDKYTSPVFSPDNPLVKLNFKLDKTGTVKTIQSSKQFAPDKKFIITFTDPIDASTITSDSIYVEDSDGNRINVSLSYDKDKNQVTVTPVSNYTHGTYTMYIIKSVLSAKEKPVTQAVKYLFTVL